MAKKIILVTGCSRGIGFSTVQHLVAQGYSVYAATRNIKNSELLNDLKSNSKNLNLVELDITKSKLCKLVVEDIVKKEGRIDTLINCAAHIVFGPVDTITIQQAKKQFEVNLFGVLKLIQNVLPHMKKAKQGHIVCLGSSSGVESSPMYGLYSASKFALESMLFALSANVSPWNILVSIVELTATCTDILQKSLEFGKKQKDPEHILYVKNAYSFLSNIINKGESPDQIAKHILHLIEQIDPPLRSMATEHAKQIFSKELTDPYGERWQETIENQKTWYEKEIC